MGALREMKMYLVTSLVLLPALVLGEDGEAAPSFTDYCDFFKEEINKTEEVLGSLKWAKDAGLLDVSLGLTYWYEANIGAFFYWVCPPTLHKLMNVDQTPSGKEFVRCCNDFYTEVNKPEVSKQMEGLISAECEGASGSSRGKRTAVTVGGMSQ